MARRSLIAALLCVLSTVAYGQTPYFNLFQPPPSTGVMKGSPNTYITTNAASSDIITLFNTSSTCTSPSTEFLRADGVCAVPAGSGSGSVTSVNYTAPTSLFSCTGGPITGSGTIACTFATGQTPTELFGTDGSGNVSLFALTGNYVPPINLASTSNGGISNTLGVAHGGSGAVSLTAHGILIGEGTSAINALAALATDTVVMGQGTSADPAGAAVPNCGSGTTALSYSTSTHAFGCQTISAGTGTVTSVGMTVPSVLSVTPASITTSGTFALGFAGSQSANMGLFTPNGTTGPLGLRSLVVNDLPTSGVTAGSYTNSNITVDARGRVTSASNGTGGGGGGVTSVGMTVPSWLSVSPSTITSSGTFAITGTPGLTANQFLATPNGLTGAVALRSIVAADLPSSITSNTSGNAATATALAATPAGCSTNQYATTIAASGNLTCAQVAYSQLSGTPSIPGLANPTGTIGLSAINGSATTAMRSDAAPALSQAIAPTWTATHTFAATSGAALAAPSFSIYANSLLPSTGFGGALTFVGSSGSPVAGRLLIGDGSGWHFKLAKRSSGATTDLVDFADTGNVTVPAPSSGGVALAVGGTYGGAFVPVIGAESTGGTGNFFGSYDGTHEAIFGTFSAGGFAGTASNHQFAIITDDTQRAVVSAAGNVTVNPVTSGVDFSAGGAGSAFVASQIQAVSSGSDSFVTTYDGTIEGLFGSDTTQMVVGAFSSHALKLRTSNTDRIAIAAAGNITVNAPTSGVATAITGLSGSPTLTLGASSGAASTLEAGWNLSALGEWALLSQSTDGFGLGTAGTGSLALLTGATNRLTIDSNGHAAVNAPSSAGAALTTNGLANSYTQVVNASSTSGQSFGMQIAAGTTSADRAFQVSNQANSTSFLTMFGDGGTVLGAATGGDKGLGTINATGIYVNGAAVGSGSSGANPTATVGLTTTNGSATTFMRSDAAPALNQSISPTWTGTHTFSNPITVNGAGSSLQGGITVTAPASGNAFSATGVAGSLVGLFTGSSTTGSSYGLGVSAGTNSSDYSFLVTNQSGSTNYLKVPGDGGVVVGAPSGGDKGLGTVNMTGCYVNGVSCSNFQTEAAGIFTSTCSASVSKNISCSSHTSGTGIYNLSVSAAGFTVTPICTVSGNGPVFAQYAYGSSSTTIVQVATYNISGGNADEAFSIICVQ